MGHIIAIAGKGGTGKTTIAALIVRLLKEAKKGSILAVDADPNSNLADSLGLTVKETIGSILDNMPKDPQKIPAGMTKDRFIEYQVQTTVSEGDGFDLIAMGRPEGPGCYCYVNNVLRNTVGALIKDYDFIVIDNEAGLEHFSRRTTRSADTLVVVSDPTGVGLKSAQRIAALVKELGIKSNKSFLLINRDDVKKKPAGTALDYLGSLPLDEQIVRASRTGISIWQLDNDAASLNALRKLGEKIWS